MEISRLNRDKKAEFFTGEVVYYNKKNIVLIHAPASSEIYEKLPNDEEYSVKFVGKNGIFGIKASINKKLPEGNPQFFELKLFGCVKYMQLRDFFRLPCTIPFNYSVLTANKPGKIHEGIIKNLSGGGIKIVTRLEMAADDTIRFSLSLGNDTYKLTGKIKHKDHYSFAMKPFVYGVMFTGMTKTVQEKIILYLHNCQLKNRKHYQSAA